MKNLKFALLGMTLILSACATDYYTYQGAPVMTGTGGATKNVNGVDLWITGTPPRKFRVIGYITDSRPGRGIAMMERDGAIAAEAKAKGGDGVLMNTDNEQVMGAVSLTSVNTFYHNAFINSTAMPITRRNSTFYVIKYVN